MKRHARHSEGLESDTNQLEQRCFELEESAHALEEEVTSLNSQLRTKVDEIYPFKHFFLLTLMELSLRTSKQREATRCKLAFNCRERSTRP